MQGETMPSRRTYRGKIRTKKPVPSPEEDEDDDEDNVPEINCLECRYGFTGKCVNARAEVGRDKVKCFVRRFPDGITIPNFKETRKDLYRLAHYGRGNTATGSAVDEVHK